VDQAVSWTERDEAELRRHCAEGKLLLREIAALLGKKVGSVGYHARKLGIYKTPAGRQGEGKRKHKHLRRAAFTFFLTHSFEETAEKFSLTKTQLKSLMSVCYKDPEFSHLRKDTRRKDPWSLEEMLFLLRFSGVQPRSWIAKSLDRSGARNIKERMQGWNASTKWLNGMPLAWAKTLWPEADPPSFKTEAGPTYFKFRIVTWHDAAILAGKYKTPPEIKACIRAMVRFQEFIHGTRSKAAIKRRFTTALSGGKRWGKFKSASHPTRSLTRKPLSKNLKATWTR